MSGDDDSGGAAVVMGGALVVGVVVVLVVEVVVVVVADTVKSTYTVALPPTHWAPMRLGPTGASAGTVTVALKSPVTTSVTVDPRTANGGPMKKKFTIEPGSQPVLVPETTTVSVGAAAPGVNTTVSTPATATPTIKTIEPTKMATVATSFEGRSEIILDKLQRLTPALADCSDPVRTPVHPSPGSEIQRKPIGNVYWVPNAHYVYLYRSDRGRPMYVGYGKSVDRALSHSDSSHNADLKDWLTTSRFELSVAGPFRDETEARHVEAALISAIDPEFNRVAGDGPKFVPLGVPPELSARPVEAPLGLSDLGRITGGALVVFLSSGGMLSDGRTKFDPASPDDAIVVSNIEGVWDIGRHSDDWTYGVSAPRVLIGVHGHRPTHRFIAGASLIDQERWFTPSLDMGRRSGSHRWNVPLSEPINLDACGLRGRRVEGVKFGQFSWQLHIWVDGEGHVRHPTKVKPDLAE